MCEELANGKLCKKTIDAVIVCANVNEMLEVVFYRTAEGDSPVREYLDSLDAKQGGKGAVDYFCGEGDTSSSFGLPGKDDRH